MRRAVGLQGWLVAAFVAVGVVASLAVLLVVLPALESSVRAEQAPREAEALRQRLTQIAGDLRLPFDVTEEQLQALAIEVRSATAAEVRVLYEPDLFGGFDPVVTQAPDDPELLDAAPVPFETSPGAYVGSEGVWASASLLTNNGSRLYLAAAAPLRGVTAELAIVRQRVIVAMVLVLSLASLGGLALSRLIGRRIRNLADTASTLAGGDLSARAPAMAPAELDTLSASLNGMAGRLEALVAEITSERDRDRALLGSLAEGVVAVGRDGEVMVANGAARRLLSLPEDAGTVRVEALPAPVMDVVRAGLADPEPGLAEHEVALASGIELELAVTRLGAERANRVVLTLRDVTEERRLARARRDLVANVSHELKTPLSALKGFLELLEGGGVDERHRGEFIALMSQETDRLERLIEEQLQLARLDAGAMPLDRQPVDLGELAAEAAAPQVVLAERAGVSLHVDGPPQPLVADADPARVEQVLVILLDNALRHTESGGRITVAVRRDGPDGLLTVRDTGSGIPEDEQPFVFDRFYRGDASREGRSAGLGLAIARGLARAHGGAIELRSVAGLGSTFTLRLPLAAPDASTPAPAAAPAGVAPAGR